MSHIDSMITEANLRDVKVFDFDSHLAEMEQDLDTTAELLRKQGIWEDSIKGFKKREEEVRALKDQAVDWVKAVGFKSMIEEYRIVVLIEKVS